MGVSRDAIADDYALSHAFGISALGLKSIQEKLPEVTAVKWGSAPREYILDLLAYIDKRYGSVQTYLIGSGFGLAQQERLVHALTKA